MSRRWLQVMLAVAAVLWRACVHTTAHTHVVTYVHVSADTNLVAHKLKACHTLHIVHSASHCGSCGLGLPIKPAGWQCSVVPDHLYFTVGLLFSSRPILFGLWVCPQLVVGRQLATYAQMAGTSHTQKTVKCVCVIIFAMLPKSAQMTRWARTKVFSQYKPRQPMAAPEPCCPHPPLHFTVPPPLAWSYFISTYMENSPGVGGVGYLWDSHYRPITTVACTRNLSPK